MPELRGSHPAPHAAASGMGTWLSVGHSQDMVSAQCAGSSGPRGGHERRNMDLAAQAGGHSESRADPRRCRSIHTVTEPLSEDPFRD